MNLMKTLRLLVEEFAGRNIRLVSYADRRTFYDGDVQRLMEYCKTHTDLNQCDGFPVQV